MIIRADARLMPLRDGCVQCVVTSPPYWGLRDYGNGSQIGLEPTPDAYVAVLVAVFREVGRVLRDDGTVWLNLGDSYASGEIGRHDARSARALAFGCVQMDGPRQQRRVDTGLKPKDLVGIPWRVAFALQADGWYLRSDIIWHKPNPMPESVTDRPTKAHEYVFLLAKSERYYYDADAIKTRSDRAGEICGTVPKSLSRGQGKGANVTASGNGVDGGFCISPAMSNKRSVWTIPTLPYAGAHFATMPEALITPCVLAGCPVGGLVLDPFLGSGTVGAVAERLDRRWVGTDLSYQHLATKRTAQMGIRF